MKKSENLVATLLVIYGILCAISIALYALIQLFVDDKPTATNLLLWSATIFAPIAVLMTYTSWKEQKREEEVANLARKLHIDLTKISSFVVDIAQSQNPKSRTTLIQKDGAKYLLKNFSSIISIHMGDLGRVKEYCNDEYSKVIDTFLLETEKVHQYIVYSAWELRKVDYQGVDLSDYHNNFRRMCDCLFEISNYRN
ncbi:hypothetical protein GFH30_04690 [Acinetobacter wanghuae]|uniref:DUF4760 domain-containing protein n=1 Tax=Acinetobacter wanghuae TaxID=2662362 RepID=A0A5Q0P3U8_9GAMM|nr:hypothetical protein [Acinetobacter wanghuae]MQW92097.1 hypothetical protein [Acinetobacter wanghuae]QGA10731.1 hypothetical protein GFH30_04690 [Acinetobacter wanghuae]